MGANEKLSTGLSDSDRVIKQVLSGDNRVHTTK